MWVNHARSAGRAHVFQSRLLHSRPTSFCEYAQTQGASQEYTAAHSGGFDETTTGVLQGVRRLLKDVCRGVQRYDNVQQRS
jgi:hypothetical protein